MWYFFLLLNAYYGGAMTMFFTSTVTIPFNTIRDVMRAHPEWDMIFMDGNEVLFAYLALNGDPDYAAFWERVEADPEDIIYKGQGDGLRRLVKPGQKVMHALEGVLKGYLRENPFFNQRLR